MTLTSTVRLTRGLFAQIDAADHGLVSQHRFWQAIPGRGRHYAMTRIGNRNFLMHRMILGLKHGDGILVDHINGDGLDNRRANLRIATCSENGRNRKMQANNTTGYRGVSWNVNGSRKRPFTAAIKVHGKTVHLGCFETALAAHLAYVEASKEHHGLFGQTRAR